LGFFVIFSCQNEPDFTPQVDISEIGSVNDYVLRLTMEDLKNDPVFNSIVKNYQLEPNLGIKQSNNRIGKTIGASNDEFDFTIQTNAINVIEEENYTSYTFMIKPRTGDFNIMENLVLENKDGIESAFILKYHFLENSREPLLLKKNETVRATIEVEFLGDFDFSSQTETTSEDISKSTSSNCVWIWVLVPYYCHCKSHAPWESCICSPPSSWREELVQICSEDPEDITEILLLDGSNDPFGGPGGGSGGPSGGGSGTGMITADVSELIALGIETQINTPNLDPCTTSILDDLKDINAVDIKNVILRFDSPDVTYFWAINNGVPTNPASSGETTWFTTSGGEAIPYNYLTLINPNYINNATKIGIARLLLHELLHAYMLSHIDDVVSGQTGNITQFVALWNSIRNNLYGGDLEAQQHEFMAQKFLTPLKDALKDWDNASQPDQYYEDLAWGALDETSTFDHFHPPGSASRLRIKRTNIAEDTNTTQGGITPKGSPCD